MGGDFFDDLTLADFALSSPPRMVPNSTPQLPGQYYWGHNGYTIVQLYFKFNDSARNSTDITKTTQQSPHVQIATYLTRPFRAISLHQSWDGSQRSANCDCEVVLHVQRCCSQFNQYHKLHTPMATRTDRHIPHTTVPCNTLESKSRRFVTVC